MIDKETGVDLMHCDRSQLAQVLQRARNSIFQAAITVCEDLHAKGLNAGHCATALRVMQDQVNAKVAAVETVVEESARQVN